MGVLLTCVVVGVGGRVANVCGGRCRRQETPDGRCREVNLERQSNVQVGPAFPGYQTQLICQSLYIRTLSPRNRGHVFQIIYYG